MSRSDNHRRRRRGWLPLGLMLSTVWAGCHSTQMCCKEDTPIPKGTLPPALGTHVYAHRNVQANLAEADDFVIYEHEWANGESTLNRYGEYHLNLIVKRLPTAPFPVIIQPHSSELINQARRLAIVQYLLNCGIADAEARVVVDLPQAEGLDGEEARMVTDNALLGQFLTGTVGNAGGFSNNGLYGGAGLYGGGGFFGGNFFRSGQYGGGGYGGGLRGFGGGYGGYGRSGVGGFWPY